MIVELDSNAAFYKEYFGRYDMEGEEADLKYDVEDHEWERLKRFVRPFRFVSKFSLQSDESSSCQGH